MSYDALQPRLLIVLDGVSVLNAATGCTRQILNGGCFVLGNDQDSICGGFSVSQRFTGSLDDFNVFRRFVSLAEAQSLYSTRCVNSSDPLLWGSWSFDDSSVSYDSSMYAHDLVVKGVTREVSAPSSCEHVFCIDNCYHQSQSNLGRILQNHK